MRSVLILFQCAPDSQHQLNKLVLLVVMDKTNPFREIAISILNAASIKWCIAYEAALLSAVLAAVNAAVGITARPLEM